MRKTLLVLVATATVGALSVSLVSGSASAAATPHPVLWGTCQPEPGDVLDARQQCTTLRVPLDYHGLGTTQAAVRTTYLRLAATLDRAPLPDLDGSALRSIMFNTLYSNDRFPLLAEFPHAVKAGTPLPPSPFPPPGALANLVAAQTATGCNDVAWPRSVSSYMPRRSRTTGSCSR